MAASDNVLRGGLTGNHVDVPELLRVLDATPAAAPLVTPHAIRPGVVTFPVPADGASGTPFTLARPTVGPGRPHELLAPAGPALLLAVDGALQVSVGDRSERVRRGGAVMLDALGPAATIRVSGVGAAFLAGC